MSSNTLPKQLHRQQSGMVSILVTMIMMVIISLIVLGFAQISRREQRLSLDSQLSTQAYYAAESGINDTRSAILSFLSGGSNVPSKTSCANDSNYSLSPTIDATSKVGYPCVLVDAQPKQLNYTIDGTSTVVPLVSSSGSFGPTGITLTWKKPVADAGTPFTGCYSNVNLGKFPPASGVGQWGCPYGALQVDLVPVPTGSSISRAGLTANTKTVFLEPINGTTVPANTNEFSMFSSSTGSVVPASCDDTSCVAYIRDLSANRYYMRVNSVYKSNFNLTINAGSGAGFQDAQAVVDSTGKAQDVMRRIRAVLDITDANSSAKAGAAIITQDSICKRFSVANGYFSNGSATSYPGGTDNALCQPGTTGTLTSSCVAPHDIILVLDASSSMGINWEGITRKLELQNVAKTFVDSTGVSTTGNHIAVVSFNTPATLDSPFSANAAAIKTAIDSYTTAGGTNYTAGLTAANSELTGPDARSGVPKVLVFISDGKPDKGGSPAVIVTTTDAMKASGILIYAIGIVGGDGGTGLISSMASTPTSTYYVTADTHISFEDFFAGVSSQISC